MSIGKYISLEEARKHKKLERFAKEHPSEGDLKKFKKLLEKMSKSKTPVKGKKASRRD